MSKEAILYFLAAGLFALAAGINVGKSREIDLSSVLMLVTAIIFAWLGARKRTVRD